MSLDPRHVLNFLSRGTQKDLDIIGDKYAINVKNESLALRFIKKHQEERGGSNAASCSVFQFHENQDGSVQILADFKSWLSFAENIDYEDLERSLVEKQNQDIIKSLKGYDEVFCEYKNKIDSLIEFRDRVVQNQHRFA